MKTKTSNPTASVRGPLQNILLLAALGLAALGRSMPR